MKRKYRRRSNSVGQCRMQLTVLILKECEKQDIKIKINPEDLEPVRGYWAQQDVYRWEGTIEMFISEKWRTVSICSWDKMVDCVKHGIEITNNGYQGIEIFSKG